MFRPSQHMSDSHSAKIQEWVADLSKIGYAPEIEVLEESIRPDDLNAKELFWVAKSLRRGDLLLNQHLVRAATLINKTVDTTYEPKDTVMEEVSVVIKNKRKLLGMTQAELADRLGIALTVVRKIEQRQNNLSLAHFERFLAYFKLKLKLDNAL